jgi:hypothetical protein
MRVMSREGFRTPMPVLGWSGSSCRGERRTSRPSSRALLPKGRRQGAQTRRRARPRRNEGRIGPPPSAPVVCQTGARSDDLWARLPFAPPLRAAASVQRGALHRPEGSAE